MYSSATITIMINDGVSAVPPSQIVQGVEHRVMIGCRYECRAKWTEINDGMQEKKGSEQCEDKPS